MHAQPDPDVEEVEDVGSDEALQQHVAGWQASPVEAQLDEAGFGGGAHATGAMLVRGGSGLRRRESRHPSTEHVS